MDGSPKQIKWLKDGIAVDENLMTAKNLGNGKYQLVVNEVKESDQGEYAVQVSHDEGLIESKASITLKAGKLQFTITPCYLL